MSDYAQYVEWMKMFTLNQLTPPISATPSSATDSSFIEQSLAYLNQFSTTQPILTTNDDFASSFSNNVGIPSTNLLQQPISQQSHGISQTPFSTTISQWQPIAPDTDAYMATLDSTVISQLTGAYQNTSSFTNQPTTSFSLASDGDIPRQVAPPPGYIESASSFTNLLPIAKPIPIRPTTHSGALISSAPKQAYITPYQSEPASCKPPSLRLRHSISSSVPPTLGTHNVLPTQSPASIVPDSVQNFPPSSGLSVEVHVEIHALEKEIAEWQEKKTKKERDWDIHQFKKSVAEGGTQWNAELEKNRHAQYERRHRYVIEDCNWYIDDRRSLLERLKNTVTSAEAMTCVEERRMNPLRGMKPTRNEIKRKKKEQLLGIKKPPQEERKRRLEASSPRMLGYHGETQAHESLQSLHGMEQAVIQTVDPPLPSFNASTQIGRPLYVNCTGEDGSTEKPFTGHSSFTPRIVSREPSNTSTSGFSSKHHYSFPIAKNPRVYSEIVIARWQGKVEHRRITLRKVLKTWRKKVAHASQQQGLVPVTIRNEEPVAIMEEAEPYRDSRVLEPVAKKPSRKRRRESIGEGDEIPASFPSGIYETPATVPSANEHDETPVLITFMPLQFDDECHAPEDTVTRDESAEVVIVKDEEKIIVEKTTKCINKREQLRDAAQQEKKEEFQWSQDHFSQVVAQARSLAALLAPPVAPAAHHSEFASMAPFDPPSHMEKEWWSTTEGSVYCPRCGEEVGGGPTRRKTHYKKRHHFIFYKLAPPSHSTKLEKKLHEIIGAFSEGVRTCLFCPSQVSTRMLMLRHFEKKHPSSIDRLRDSFASLANRKEKTDEGEVYRFLVQ